MTMPTMHLQSQLPECIVCAIPYRHLKSVVFFPICTLSQPLCMSILIFVVLCGFSPVITLLACKNRCAMLFVLTIARRDNKESQIVFVVRQNLNYSLTDRGATQSLRSHTLSITVIMPSQNFVTLPHPWHLMPLDLTLGSNQCKIGLQDEARLSVLHIPTHAQTSLLYTSPRLSALYIL